jgi:hypothetical protein
MSKRHPIAAFFALAAVLVPITPALAQGICPAISASDLETHTAPPSGDELLHQNERAWVGLKIVIRPDGSSEVEVSHSSGLTALNQRAVAWVHDHWRWPRGCAPGTTRRYAVLFQGW